MDSKITKAADLDKIGNNPIFYEIIRTEESTIDIEKIKAIALNEKELKGIANTTM